MLAFHFSLFLPTHLLRCPVPSLSTYIPPLLHHISFFRNLHFLYSCSSIVWLIWLYILLFFIYQGTFCLPGLFHLINPFFCFSIILGSNEILPCQALIDGSWFQEIWKRWICRYEACYCDFAWASHSSIKFVFIENLDKIMHDSAVWLSWMTITCLSCWNFAGFKFWISDWEPDYLLNIDYLISRLLIIICIIFINLYGVYMEKLDEKLDFLSTLVTVSFLKSFHY